MISIPAGWEDTVNTAIYKASCAAMRMDPESNEACTFFRASWPSDGDPAPPPNQDVCYYRLYNRDDPTANTYRQPTVDGMKCSETLPLVCQWIFYGPNASGYSTWLRTALYRRVVEKVDDVEYPPPIVILSHSNIVLEPFPTQPVRLPEPSTDGWRNRSDLTIQFTLTQHTNILSDGVEVPPDIHLVHE